MKKFLLPWLTMAFAVTALVAVSGGAAKTEATAAPASAEQGAFSMAIVTDIGGLNDRGFNQLANQGRLRAQRELKIQTRVFISNSPQDYVPNLSAAARGGHDLVIAVGFLMVDAVNTVARSFPNTKFAMVDGAIEGLKDKPTNVRGLLFKEQEAGYLVGYLAGLQVKRRPVGGNQKVGAVGGIKIPPVDRFIAGYRAGARKANRRVQVLISYSQSFTDTAKCKEAALNQISNGASVIFQVAGGCGLGALSAAKDRRVFGIGVDADQGYLGQHVLTSALKKVDVAVFLTTKAAKAQGARFRGGFNAILGVKTGGVGLGKVSRRAHPADVAATRAQQRLIAAGKVAIPQRVP